MLNPANGRPSASLLALALTPSLVGVWASPGFVTQDGPAHLYNAAILAASFGPDSPFGPTYAVRWEPLPNWAGHLLYLGVGSALPPGLAERAATSITLIMLAAATARLRRVVAGTVAPRTTATLAAIVGLNVSWLFGFGSFLIGAALFAITLAAWWDGRDRMTGPRAAGLAVLIAFGYFCHPVSLGLTALGLLVLESTTPARSGRLRRLAGTLSALLPLVPLGLIYRRLARAGGPIRPEWQFLSRPLSPSAWIGQLGWADPISLAAKVYRPFGARASLLNVAASPAAWCGIGLVALAVATLRDPDRDRARRGWGLLAGLLLLGGLLGPDTVGAGHGNYLPQRVTLLGLVALVPWLRLDRAGTWARCGRAALVVGLVLQSLFVWDYGLESTRTAGRMLDRREQVGRGRRVAAVLLESRGRFRANPSLHADCLLGVGTGNIIWGNYETNHYYFPVQLRDPAASPAASTIEAIARLDGPGQQSERARLWSELLERHGDAIDVVMIVGRDADVEAITATRFVRSAVDDDGRWQVWTRPGVEPIRAPAQVGR